MWLNEMVSESDKDSDSENLFKPSEHDTDSEQDGEHSINSDQKKESNNAHEELKNQA